MPVLIAIVVLSFVAGSLVPRSSIVYAFTGVLAVLANVAFVWAIADGQGDDPAWIIVLSLAGGAVAFAAAWAGVTARRRLGHAGATTVPS